MNNLELTEAIEAWVALRDEVRAREKAFEESIAEDKAMVEVLAETIRDALREAKLTSVKLEGKGTAYTSNRVSAKVESPDEFFNFVLESGRTELLQARANDKAVEEYIEEAKVPPPGVRAEKRQTLNFRSKK
jgi:hypothetical protein